MGKMQRDNGARVEREMVARHIEEGIHSERVPLSGMAKGMRMGEGHDIDVYISKDKAPLVGEVKARRHLPGWLLGWLGENDFLMIKEDRKEPVVVLPLRVWFYLLKR